MTTVISEKIVGVSVVEKVVEKPVEKATEKPVEKAIEKVPEHLTAEIKPYDRPAKLTGTTYKLTPPAMNAALYVTINDLEFPDGTRRPLEVFLNSKDVAHNQWMTAVAILLSAILRQPLPFEFAISELKEIIDPNGAYFIPKGNSGGKGKCGGIVAHVGRVLEEHCKNLGLMTKPEIPEAQKKALEAKKVEAESKGLKGQTCPKCKEDGLYMMDGCLTCVSCGDSKCN